MEEHFKERKLSNSSYFDVDEANINFKIPHSEYENEEINSSENSIGEYVPARADAERDLKHEQAVDFSANNKNDFEEISQTQGTKLGIKSKMRQVLIEIKRFFAKFRYSAKKNNKPDASKPVEKPSEKKTPPDNKLEILESVKKNLQDMAVNIIASPNIKASGILIGEGGFGSVYKGFWGEIPVAIKEFSVSLDDFKKFKNELSLMSRQKVFIGIVMELMTGDLENLLLVNQLDNSTRLKICLQLVEAVVYIHENGLVHRDIKPKNILLDEENNLKLSDFGVAKILENKENTETASMTLTTRYSSHELLFENITSFKCDVWALGLVIYEVFSGKKPWGNLSQNKIVIELGTGKSPCQASWASELAPEYSWVGTVVDKCLDYDYNQRPASKELLEIMKNYARPYF